MDVEAYAAGRELALLFAHWLKLLNLPHRRDAREDEEMRDVSLRMTFIEND